ncbi:MAG: hypothetical protein JO203_13600 [Gammaproteobacteria bacterium]|nr:hypothetical protein [Gammaproteobacteria bacterium]
MQRYFDYGRSIEGKLRRMVGRTPAQDAAIVATGWLSEECDVDTRESPGKLVFDIYGMSFTNQIAARMEASDPRLASQRFGGPAAPPSHSYACFARRVGRRHLAPVQIIGVLASSVPRMQTLSGLTTSFEVPEPFTYPRYSLGSAGRLQAEMPAITSRSELRAALADPPLWQAFVAQLRHDDGFYAEDVFRADIFDHSVLGRLLRRAWGQRTIRNRTDALRPQQDFAGAPDLVATLRAMLLDFSEQARTAGSRPVVILLEDRGYGRTLAAMLTETLRENSIDFVATSAIVPTSDSANFLPDGHFTPPANEKIAAAVLAVLGRR